MKQERGKILEGIAASPGIGMGDAFCLQRRRHGIRRYHIEESDVEAELLRFDGGVVRAIENLNSIMKEIDSESSRNHYDILQAHTFMLEDPVLIDGTKKKISERRLNAEWALENTVRDLETMFFNRADETLQERVADLHQSTHHVFDQLLGVQSRLMSDIPENAVVIAENLSPSETTTFYRTRVAAIVLEKGGRASHVAIIAQSLGIPTVLGVPEALEIIRDGGRVIVDGGRGRVVVDPSDAQRERYEDRRKRRDSLAMELLDRKTAPAQTKDGTHILLGANLAALGKLANLDAFGADVVTLFRTEFMFIDRAQPPDEEEHYSCYRKLVEGAGGRPVTIRTQDLGGDKCPQYWPFADERNPLLGTRGVRTVQRHPEWMEQQVCAILRASALGPVRLLLPMITGVGELRELRELIARAKESLRKRGVAYDPDTPIGIMVETASAGIVSDRLAAECDFFSIGTNDLVQYTLAVDRDSQELAYLYSPLHPAVLRLVDSICKAAKSQNIPVALCGEIGSDPLYTLLLIGAGIDEIGMGASNIPFIRGLIRESHRSEAEKLFADALDAHTVEDVRELVIPWMRSRFPRYFSD